MLVFSRRIGEQVILDFSLCTDDELMLLRDAPIVIERTQGRSGKCGIGTDAPRFVGVHRAERYDQIEEERRRDQQAIDETKPETTK